MIRKDILICGVGGQGTVLASKIIAAAAMAEGNTVHSAETIGMAQRGGPVTSHVRIGQEVFSPLIPRGSAELMLAFEPAEAVRNLRYLRKDGLVILHTGEVRPVTESLRPSGYSGQVMTDYLRGKCACLQADLEALSAPLGSARFHNILLIGLAAGAGRMGISRESLIREIGNRVPEKYLEKNLEAFEIGFSFGKEHS
jgi:indolepyruvate ferredoxin oxidoreductase beta subunit